MEQCPRRRDVPQSPGSVLRKEMILIPACGASVTGPGAALDRHCVSPPVKGAQRVREAEQHGSQHTEGRRDCCGSQTLKGWKGWGLSKAGGTL